MEHQLICALDFGTTYSGYAFSYKNLPNDIKMNKNWTGAFGYKVLIRIPVLYTTQ